MRVSFQRARWRSAGIRNENLNGTVQNFTRFRNDRFPGSRIGRIAVHRAYRIDGPEGRIRLFLIAAIDHNPRTSLGKGFRAGKAEPLGTAQQQRIQS